VPPQNAAALVHDIAFGDGRIGKQGPIVFRGDEVLAVGLFGHLESMGPGQFPDLPLGKLTEREPGVPESHLGNPMQKVALVLGGIRGGSEVHATLRIPIRSVEPRVMARRVIVEGNSRVPEGCGQHAELEDRIAAHAGVRSPSGPVFGLEVSEDLRSVGGGEVYHTIFGSQAGAEAGAGSFVLFLAGTVAAVSRSLRERDRAVVHPHGDADHAASPLRQERSDEG
jgi:hypothetical protein